MAVNIAMSTQNFRFNCPNCGTELEISLFTPVSDVFSFTCQHCYYPLNLYPLQNVAEMRREPVRKNAFLIHSSKKEDAPLVSQVAFLLLLHGVNTIKIEDDPRTERDWLQKSIDGIRNSNFVIAVLVRRYPFTDESGKFLYKGPDKCYDEIAMAFALGTIWGHKDMFGLVEEGVDPGRVLEQRAWCHSFTRGYDKLRIDSEFFDKLDGYV